LRELTAVEGDKSVSRTVALSRFVKGSPHLALVEAFLHPEARLLVGDRGQLRLAHEALLTHWPRARDQVAADARDLELRGRLEEEAKRWQAAPRRDKNRRMIGGLPLAEARALLTRWGNQLPREVTEFIVASRRHARMQRVRLWGMVTAAPPFAAIVAMLIWAGMVWSGVRGVESEMELNQHFVAIPVGCNDMGSPDSDYEYDPDSDRDEGPLHQVCPRPFELDKFEVTQSQWRRVMVLVNPNPSRFDDDGRKPVESVSWNEVQFFIRLMSLFGHHHYRLPSEAEWEYAARAGTTTTRYWGGDVTDVCSYENVADNGLKKVYSSIVAVFASCNDGFVNTAPDGSLKPNPWGLYDMLGNVSEWVEDCYVDNYREASDDAAPVVLPAPDCSRRVLRGGNWRFGPQTARAADRSSLAPGVGNYNTGFRLARDPSP
jgi:formylglycine-generating enzyme